MQYLYIIKCEQFYKIGVANDVESRLAQLSTGNPFPLKVEIVYEFENAEHVEKALHMRYKSLKQRGEWFKLDYEELKNIHSICLALGASAYEYSGNTATDEVIEEADAQAESLSGAKYDFAAMFADGWCIEPSNSKDKKDYWVWRKRQGGYSGYIYGGRIKDLPYPDLEQMRIVYRDGNTAHLAEEQK